VTFVDMSDLASRTCPRCGAVYGDALLHRRWHRDEEETLQSVRRMLVRLFEELDLIADDAELEP
jgi:hypothetical protein